MRTSFVPTSCIIVKSEQLRDRGLSQEQVLRALADANAASPRPLPTRHLCIVTEEAFAEPDPPPANWHLPWLVESPEDCDTWLGRRLLEETLSARERLAYYLDPLDENYRPRDPAAVLDEMRAECGDDREVRALLTLDPELEENPMALALLSLLKPLPVPASCPAPASEAPPLPAEPKPPRQRTDLGNAERLADQQGDDLRYVPSWDRWLAWDGRRWQPDALNEVMRRAHLTARSIYLEASEATDSYESEELAKHAVRSENAQRLEAMVRVARAVRPFPVAPDALDSDLWLFNVENGTVDLREGRVRPHRREDLITKIAPVRFDPSATWRRWDAFLARVLPDAAVRAYVQRLAGYWLTGDVREQILPFLHGAGANGKSTFVTLLQDLLGDYGKTGAPDLLVTKQQDAHPAEVADIHGARLVVCSEVEQGRWFAEKRIKELTGGDRLKARLMYRDFFEFRPTAKLVVIANHRPKVRGTDFAIWRRVHLVPFDVTIPAAERDNDLGRKLRAELPGILNWALRGCLEWQRGGLKPPKAIADATHEYRQEQDHVAQFVAECCETTPDAVPMGEIYARYKLWAEAAGDRPWGKNAVGAELTRLGHKDEYRYVANLKKKVRMRCGLRVLK